MNALTIEVKKLTQTAVLPTRGSAQAAGYDLYADLAAPVTIAPHTSRMISTGLSMAIPDGYFGAVFARSGLAARELLRPGNCVGVVDPDYRGEWKIILHNDGEVPREIEPGERIAQVVFLPFLGADFHEVEALSGTERGEGGFGSTGKK